MTDQKIEAHKITKPIQLLGAWLVGLVLTDSIFLGAAITLTTPSWERGALILAAIFNVPFFLAALFLLQTKFRAELQEDTFYSEYISKKSDVLVRVDRDALQDYRLTEVERQLAQVLEPRTRTGDFSADLVVPAGWGNWSVGLNLLHPAYKDIKRALSKASIPIASIFGGKVDSVPPEKWIVSLSPDLPIDRKIQILKVILPHGFDGLEISEPMRELGDNEDVYLGSYGVSTYSLITSELNDLLEEDVHDVDLILYCQRNLIGSS